MAVYVGGSDLSAAAANGKSVVEIFLGDVPLWPLIAKELFAAAVSLGVAAASVVGLSQATHVSSGSSAGAVLVVNQQAPSVSESEVFAEIDDRDYDALAVSLSYIGGSGGSLGGSSITSASTNSAAVQPGLFASASSESESFAELDDRDLDARAVSLSYPGSGFGLSHQGISESYVSGVLAAEVSAAAVSESEVYAEPDDKDYDARSVSLSYLGSDAGLAVNAIPVSVSNVDIGLTVSAVAAASSEAEVFAVIDDADKDASAVSLCYPGGGLSVASAGHSDSSSSLGSLTFGLSATATSEAEVYASVDDSDKDANAVSLSYVGGGSGMGQLPINSGSYIAGAVSVSCDAAAVSESEVYAEPDDRDYDARAVSLSYLDCGIASSANAGPISVSNVFVGCEVASLAQAVSEAEVYASVDDADKDAESVSLSYVGGGGGSGGLVSGSSGSALLGGVEARIVAETVSESEVYAWFDDADKDAYGLSISYPGGGAELGVTGEARSDSVPGSISVGLRAEAVSEAEVYASVDDADKDANSVSLSYVGSGNGLGGLPMASASFVSGGLTVLSDAPAVSEAEVYAVFDDSDKDAVSVSLSYPASGFTGVAAGSSGSSSVPGPFEFGFRAEAVSEAEVYASVDDADKDANAVSLSYPSGSYLLDLQAVSLSDSSVAVVAVVPSLSAACSSEAEVYASVDDADKDANAVSLSHVGSGNGLGGLAMSSGSFVAGGVKVSSSAVSASEAEVYAAVDDADKDANAVSLSYPAGVVVPASSVAPSSGSAVTLPLVPVVGAAASSEAEVFAAVDDADKDGDTVSLSYVGGVAVAGLGFAVGSDSIPGPMPVGLRATAVSECEAYASVDDADKDALAVSLSFIGGGGGSGLGGLPINSGLTASASVAVSSNAAASSESKVYAELDDRDEDATAVSLSHIGGGVTVLPNDPPSISGWNYAAANTVAIPAHKVGDLILVWAGASGTGTVAAPAAPVAGGTVPAFTTLAAAAGVQQANSTSSAFASRSQRFAYAVAKATNHTLGAWGTANSVAVAVVTNVSDAPIGKHAETGLQFTAMSNYNLLSPSIALQHGDGRSILLRTAHIDATSTNSFLWSAPAGSSTAYTGTGNPVFYATRRNKVTDAPTENIALQISPTLTRAAGFSTRMTTLEVVGLPNTGISEQSELVDLITAGSHTVPIPAWATRIDVVACGGGGGGNQAAGFIAGLGGSAGSWASRRFTSSEFAAGGSIAVTVGAGGKGGQGGIVLIDTGKDGGASTVRVGAATVTAAGGKGGDNVSLSQWGQSPGNHNFQGEQYRGGTVSQTGGASGGLPGAGGSGANGVLLGVGGVGGSGGGGRVWIRFSGFASP